MREIKLNCNPFLLSRQNILKVEVDENDLDFRNGVALAEATCTIITDSRTTKTVECYGLIDEEFKEVYNDEYTLESELMFFLCNKEAYRLSDNDYIIAVACSDGENAKWTDYRHIRTVDGVPTFINQNLGKPYRTGIENVVILNMSSGFHGKVLYDFSLGKEITPRLASIKEAEGAPGLFDVEARITLEPKENQYELIDHLFFRIDGTGRIVSNVVSSLDNDYLSVLEGCTTEKLIEDRTNSLRNRAAQFEEEVKEFRKKSTILPKKSSGYVIKPKQNN